jgi:hypothetical protein
MGKPARASALDAALALVRAWGAQGGKIGGKSRMAKLTTEERRALAKKAASARWRKPPKTK